MHRLHRIQKHFLKAVESVAFTHHSKPPSGLAKYYYRMQVVGTSLVSQVATPSLTCFNFPAGENSTAFRKASNLASKSFNTPSLPLPPIHAFPGGR